MNSKEIRFQIKSKDIGARIGELEINGKKIETPAIMPVYNPNKPIISMDELRDKFKIKILMVNSYILYKNSNIRERVIEKG
ncbi:MAG: tRNA-guanine(15) transglycosylase, partial [Candidatus Altiarchaeales archaeon]